MSTWHERAEQQIEQDFDNGHIDGREYQAQMRDLRCEMEEEATGAAQDAYDNAIGNW